MDLSSFALFELLAINDNPIMLVEEYNQREVKLSPVEFLWDFKANAKDGF